MNLKISKPEIQSIDRQIFFIEQDCEECEDNQNIVDFGKINLSEDPIKPAFFNHIQSFTIHLPDELEWFTDANILTQEGDDAGSINPFPSFDSDDPQTVTILSLIHI